MKNRCWIIGSEIWWAISFSQITLFLLSGIVLVERFSRYSSHQITFVEYVLVPLSLLGISLILQRVKNCRTLEITTNELIVKDLLTQQSLKLSKIKKIQLKKMVLIVEDGQESYHFYFSRKVLIRFKTTLIALKKYYPRLVVEY